MKPWRDQNKNKKTKNSKYVDFASSETRNQAHYMPLGDRDIIVSYQ